MKRIIQIGENIRNIRKSKNISQEDLAERASINAPNYGQIERGQYASIETLIKISDALEVPITDFFSDVPASIRENTTVINQITDYLKNMTIEEQEAILRIVKIFNKYKSHPPNNNL